MKKGRIDETLIAIGHVRRRSASRRQKNTSRGSRINKEARGCTLLLLRCALQVAFPAEWQCIRDRQRQGHS